MTRTLVLSLALLLAPAASLADPTDPTSPPAKAKQIAGMSIVGDHESPKALVIVPWKSSALGDTLDVSRLRGDGRGPVDREVFRRELDYYRIRSTGAEARVGTAQ